MDLKLTNKVAIVLAASKGLGKAIATALSAEGSSGDVATVSRRQDGVVLASGQGSRRYIPDERQLGGRGRQAAEGAAPRSGKSADV